MPLMHVGVDVDVSSVSSCLLEFSLEASGWVSYICLVSEPHQHFHRLTRRVNALTHTPFR